MWRVLGGMVGSSGSLIVRKRDKTTRCQGMADMLGGTIGLSRCLKVQKRGEIAHC